MKRFEFRLETVLRLRERQLEAEQVKLEQLICEERRIASALDAVGTERQQAKAFLCSRTGLEGVELRNISSFLLGMDAQAGVLRERRAGINRSIEEQRQHVIQAERNARLLTKLRDRKLQEWRQEADRELESIAQESWAAARFARTKENPVSPAGHGKRDH